MELIWASGLRERTRSELLSRAPSEAGGAILCRTSGDGGRARYLALDFEPARDDEMTESWETGLTVDPSFWVRLAKPARHRGMSILPIHTHPGCERPPRFSARDTAGERALQPVLERLTTRPSAAVVMGEHHERVGRFDEKGRRLEGTARSIGVGPRRSEQRGTPISEAFSRHVLAFGEEGQRRLAALTAVVVGASGTGSHICEQLIRLGVGRLIVIDPDVIETVNLNRIVTAFADDALALRSKAAVVAEYARRVGTGTHVEPVAQNLLDQPTSTRLSDADVLFGCTDTLASRAVLNRFAVQAFVPYWDCGTEISSGAGLRAYGRVRLVLAGGPCLHCMGTIDPQQLRAELLEPSARECEVSQGYIRDVAVVAPAVVSVNAVVASLATTSFVRWAVGDEPIEGGEWVYRSYAGDVRRHSAPRNPDCPVCGVDARLGRAELALRL